MAFDPGKVGLDRDVAFPVLVANAVAWLTGEPVPSEVRIGEPRSFVPSAAAREVVVRLPSGRAVAFASRGQPIAIGAMLEPGVYSIVERDGTGVVRTESLVANLPASERGGVAPVEHGLTGLLTDPTVGAAGGQGALWSILAAVALALGLAEWLLYALEIG
jgi:hypothetical protein